MRMRDAEMCACTMCRCKWCFIRQRLDRCFFTRTRRQADRQADRQTASQPPSHPASHQAGRQTNRRARKPQILLFLVRFSSQNLNFSQFWTLKAPFRRKGCTQTQTPTDALSDSAAFHAQLSHFVVVRGHLRAP